MSWVFIDDRFFTNRKVMSVSLHARWLYLSSLCVASQQSTDGLLDEAAQTCLMVAVGRSGNFDQLAAELVRAGLWLDNGEGSYSIHDYLEYQPSAEDQRKQRAKNAERLKRFRQRQHDGTKKPSETDDETPFLTPSETDPRPVPSRPVNMTRDLPSTNLGKTPPPAREATTVPTKVEPDSIGPVWRALVSEVPSLAPPKAYATTTGLNPNEEGPLSRGYNDSRGAGYRAADIVGLADWIKAGGLRSRASPREYICRNLCTCLDDAQKWRDAGKLAIGKDEKISKRVGTTSDTTEVRIYTGEELREVADRGRR